MQAARVAIFTPAKSAKPRNLARMFGNRWVPQTTCADWPESSGDLLPPSPPASAKINGRRPSDQPTIGGKS